MAEFGSIRARWTMLLALASILLFLFALLVNTELPRENIRPSRFQTKQRLSDKAERAAQGDQYLLGVGKADITGPVVEINFMGYASAAQVGTGLRQRIFARAFIVGDVAKPTDRFIYLNIDTSCGDTAIRNGILEGIAALGSNYTAYGQQNVAVVGTHQHSGPGAYMNYLLPQVTSLGFDPQSYQAIVDGSVLAVKRAHEALTPGYLSIATTNVTNASINRSLYAYLANPAEERAQYEDDVEKLMTMMRFQRASDGKNMGGMTWFPVHGTSMLENNTHVSGDNKGVAQYLFEKSMVDDTSAADGFVAAFSQASVGDTTPNVLGAYCDDGSGQMCTLENSTCSGTAATCHGRGPFFDKVDLGVSSCYEIGKRQFQPARSLYDSFDSIATPVSSNGVKAFHFFQDMQYFNFQLPNGTAVQTCPASLGYSFAAGTTDGPGPFDFTQNDPNKPNANPLWPLVSHLIRSPSPEQVECQKPKPILLDVGEMDIPYAWSPNLVDIQMFRVGQMFMIISPSEVTTMSGRRWKSAIAAAAKSQGITTQEPMVVIGSPANTYAHYLTTPEEYGIQRYEGASTLYGPWELPAYINLTVSNLKYLAASSTQGPPQGTLPPDNRKNSLNLNTGVVMDNPPISKSFGQVLTQPNPRYSRGAVVNATFVGANPRNNLRLEGTFTAVEQLQNGNWVQVRNDWDWFLSMTWTRDDPVLGSSHVVLSWETEQDAEAGTYRLHYYGDAKAFVSGSITPFEGISNSFMLS
ncbi:Neutral/alkaline nonlysosomal ceramidase [Microthyrium microscopicum]|uniref:Neutral ceramidase n=1 Tax=Microthyrium microscopicum TaxID=703497 RepID=A0A6A6U2U9_9PEZI|nr:Neutral/alkaline nonlysosomal ceramidase [Microthyrium microscopicum]